MQLHPILSFIRISRCNRKFIDFFLQERFDGANCLLDCEIMILVNLVRAFDLAMLDTEQVRNAPDDEPDVVVDDSFVVREEKHRMLSF